MVKLDRALKNQERNSHLFNQATHFEGKNTKRLGSLVVLLC